ncbi:MAG: LacI family DNA-binding transcriptional regulator [Chloroflexi bacterium]|nr:LacI family DNA-binding transcriptional regulator [Chloroflexota bacterium]
MKQRITIRDVAREAGVSRQTVSRVINDKGELSPATKERVQAVIRRMGYRPSRTARSLTTRRTLTVGFVVPTIANPFFAELARGVQDAGRARGYHIFLCNTDWDPAEELELLHTLAAQPVDGIILTSSRLEDEALQAFADTFHPLVLGGRLPAEYPGIGRVEVENDAGMLMAVEYLQGKGHTAIGYLAGPETAPTMSNALREIGYRKAMVACALPNGDRWIRRGNLTAEGGYQAAMQLFQAAPELTALVAHNDLMAIGAIQACQEVGRQVPDECAIVGFNDIDLAAMANPPLTTIRLDRHRFGYEMMNLLLEMIDNPGKHFPAKTIPIDGLVIRKSG